MKWIEVQIKTTTEAEEAVANILYELGVGGLAIEDPNDVLAFAKNEDDWDYIDPNLLKQDFEGVIIKGYFPESEDLIDKIELIKQNVEKIPQYNLDKGLGEVTTTEVYEKDWAESWKKYYKPKKIGEKIVVKPTWEKYKESSGEIIVELDPGMAFGTGTHETTTMCIRALEKHVRPESTIFDIGCGSGILSIAAAKLGGKKVIGVDLDELPVKVSKENVQLNKVSDVVEIRRGNLLDVVDEKADIIVSNIIAEIIVDLTSDITPYLKGDSIFISSGIIIEKIDMVVDALSKEGFKVLEISKMNGWACIVSKLEKDE
ncbi:50S ribosomal protein L11 methyltransferase [Sporanaerobacter acetigenes]|jgi:ribosomal protein L11 methyltransferase|uniref:Ribosomal protein L11 methyltransferase n=1 Tax=Sporanaerobacter acetigenes DSM 13106 TaxID=1123281 RepID=A0A1M5URK7_9FIRM|nr:50S ribosomal protein L11 methyltransferase [Sporanaerobacter acetigenes]SHH65712.1 [LSU ribosomal protein L11P]-lysine N-methyltransferase [Sporanaerobacter acetigenes DSM 13106]